MKGRSRQLDSKRQSIGRDRKRERHRREIRERPRRLHDRIARGGDSFRSRPWRSRSEKHVAVFEESSHLVLVVPANPPRAQIGARVDQLAQLNKITKFWTVSLWF